MMAQTKSLMSNLFQMDPTITEDTRKAALAVLSGSAVSGGGVRVLVVSRSEAARMIGLGPKRVDHLTNIGVLKRVRFPGSSRASGILASSVEEAVASGVVS